MGKEELCLDGGRTAEKKSEDPVREDMAIGEDSAVLHFVLRNCLFCIQRLDIGGRRGREQIAGATEDDN